jgi:ribonuclease-3
MDQELEELFNQGTPLENPKSRLQEHVQGKGVPTPRYRLVSSEGPDHCPQFTVEVLVDGQAMGIGHGGKRSEAEQDAAQDALNRLLGL